MASEEITLKLFAGNDLTVKIPSEEITLRLRRDFRNWYEMPDGNVIGILDDDSLPFGWCGKIYAQQKGSIT
jgi:hypothetical protein